MHNVDKDINQVENPIFSSIKTELKDISTKKEIYPETTPIKKGTNRLLWNAPIYSAVGVNLNDTESENPNAYWQKWAEEQEKNNQPD